MRFFNGTQLSDIMDNEVTVLLMAEPGSNEMEGVEFCRVFSNNGTPTIDFMKDGQGLHVAPIPDAAIVSRNETELAMSRYAVIIPRDSEAGKMAARLMGRAS